MDALLTALMGACLSVIVLPTFRKVLPSFPLLILFSVVATVVIVLLTRKMYIIPAVFSSLLLVVSYYYFSGQFGTLQNFLSVLIQ